MAYWLEIKSGKFLVNVRIFVYLIPKDPERCDINKLGQQKVGEDDGLCPLAQHTF